MCNKILFTRGFTLLHSVQSTTSGLAYLFSTHCIVCLIKTTVECSCSFLFFFLILPSFRMRYCLFLLWVKGCQWRWMCGTLKRFPLNGGGMTPLTKRQRVLGYPHTTYHLSPSQFPKAEGCNSLQSSFFQLLLSSLSFCVPLSSLTLISCEMRPFSGISGLIIIDNHSLFPSPLSLFLSGSASDSGPESFDALQ